MTQRFRASVQYGDWNGTGAADDADQRSISTVLRERKLISDEEFVIGVECWIGENHAGKVERPIVTVLVIEADRYEAAERKLNAGSATIDVRSVELDLSLVEFFGLFKRFSVSIGRNGLNLVDREYRVIEKR